MLTPNLLLPIKCKKPIDIISDPADLTQVGEEETRGKKKKERMMKQEKKVSIPLRKNLTDEYINTQLGPGRVERKESYH